MAMHSNTQDREYEKFREVVAGTPGTPSVGVTQDSLVAGEDTANHVLGNLPKPVVSSTYSPTVYSNIGGSVTAIVKTTPGNLYSFDIMNLSGSVAFLQFFNLATVNPIGSVPYLCYPLEPGTKRLTMSSAYFAPSQYFSTGISVGIGTAAGTLGTTGLTATNFIWSLNYQ